MKNSSTVSENIEDDEELENCKYLLVINVVLTNLL
jgi:hypothetical protein